MMRLAIRDLPASYRRQAEIAIGKEGGGSKPIAAPGASTLESLLLEQLRLLHLDTLFQREVRFHPRRRWRLDFYSSAHRLAIEVQGATYEGVGRGRHLRAVGFGRDREKVNAAIEAGIAVLEYTGEQIKSGKAMAQIERIVKGRAA